MKENNRVPYSKSDCSGCSACKYICPVNAISMESDEEGFLYPKINEEKCINCGLCLKKCSFLNEMEGREDSTQYDNFYIAKHKDDTIRLNSRSGGIFVSVSDWILDQGGAVYGCILDENLKVIHAKATTKEERNKMCKSKYVQSDLKDTFLTVAQDLNNGKKVLFSGTGCQVSGLYTYLEAKKINQDNLYTMDIVCHGCASPKVFEDYKHYVEKKYHGKIQNFEFRDKMVCGWDGHQQSFIINNKKRVSVEYRELFNTDDCNRLSCYNCKYMKVNRKSNITIGDAWGIKKANPGFNDNKGASMFIVQNEKGNEMLEIIRKDCDVLKVASVDYMQMNLSSSSKPKYDRKEFWEYYMRFGIRKTIKKYTNYGIAKKVKYKIKYFIRKKKYKKKLFLP